MPPIGTLRTGRKHHVMLPTPKVHYEMLRAEGPLNPLLAFPETLKTAILLDPFNQRGQNPYPVQQVPEYGTTYNMVRSAIAYERSGQQVIVLGPRMQEAFAHTSLKEVSAEHIQFPHACFYLATPGSKLKLWGGSDTGWHPIDGAYVMDDPNEPGVISILIWGSANDRSLTRSDDATFWFSVKVGHGTVDLDAVGNKRLDLKDLKEGVLHNVEQESRAIRRGVDLDARVSQVLDDPRNDVSDDGLRMSKLLTLSLVEDVKANVQMFLRVVINTLLYVNSTSCETRSGAPQDKARKELTEALGRKKHKNGPDARKLRKKLDVLPDYKVTWIGPTIESAERSDSDLTGRQGVKGHIRRGHWHTFRVGPRKTEAGEKIALEAQGKALKWIAPVWVGDGGQMDKPRVYGVREPVER